MSDKNGLDICVYKSSKDQLKQPDAVKKGILPKLHCTYIICVNLDLVRRKRVCICLIQKVY